MDPQPPPPPPAPTTILDLGDDLLRQILLRLPALPSLIRAACACRAFRRAARSTPAFRRSFRERHAPPVLALFLEPDMEVVPLHPCPWRRRDPGLDAADFFDVSHADAHSSRWKIQSWNPSADGYLILNNRSGGTTRMAAYSPLTQALDLFLDLPPAGSRSMQLEFYTLPSEDGREPSRVVCVCQGGGRPERAAVFSSDTMEWQIFPETTLRLSESPRLKTGTVVRRLVCWIGWMYDRIVVLDTVTFHFSLIDLPTPLQPELDEARYKLGETEDEKLCIVDIKDNTIVSWFLDNGSVVDRWIAYKSFPLQPIVRVLTGCSIEEEDSDVRVDLVAVIDGFVYLCIFYPKDTEEDCELYLSLCLERPEVFVLYKGAYRRNEAAHPYVLPWPPSLLQSKEESETEDDDPMDTEEANSVLITALQSFSQALVNDDEEKDIVAEVDVFLRSTQDDRDSLISKIATLDAQMTIARDRILRISE